MLSPAQVDHYNTEGYTVVGNFLSNEQIAAFIDEMDAASAAIEKAKAKAAAAASMSPEEKLRDQIASMQTRIGKAADKLEKAKAEGADTVDALQLGYDKMSAKLDKAKAELAQTRASRPGIGIGVVCALPGKGDPWADFHGADCPRRFERQPRAAGTAATTREIAP